MAATRGSRAEPAPFELFRDVPRFPGGKVLGRRDPAAVRTRCGCRAAAFEEPGCRVAARAMLFRSGQNLSIIRNHEQALRSPAGANGVLQPPVGGWRGEADPQRRGHSLHAGGGGVKHGDHVHHGDGPPHREQVVLQPLPALGGRESGPGGMSLDDVVAIDQRGIATPAVFGYTTLIQQGGVARHAAEHPRSAISSRG